MTTVLSRHAARSALWGLVALFVASSCQRGAPPQPTGAIPQGEQRGVDSPTGTRSTSLAPVEVVANQDAGPDTSSPEHQAGRQPNRAGRPVDSRAEPLKIAFISYANPQQVVKDIEPVTRYLEQAVGVPVKGFVTTDYGSSIEAMRGAQADLAFGDPLAFMMAHEQIGVRPLLLEVYYSGKPSYHSSIWVRKDSQLRNLSDLKGKTIAFADQIDMSGHLLPRDIFVREGLVEGSGPEREFFKQVFFAGGDEQAIRAVLNKFVDAGGVSQYADLLLRPEERDQVTTIANSIDSPSHLVMARRDLPEEICDRVKQALLALDVNRPHDKSMLDKLYGVRGYREAKLSDFAEVAEIAARYGFVQNPRLFAAQEATQ